LTLITIATKNFGRCRGAEEVRVSKEKAAGNRDALLQAASRLFRQRGIDGVGVADIAREAGLTHGALYAHFPSKDALAAEAFCYGFNVNMAEFAAATGDRRLAFEDHLDGLFSPDRRDAVETGCPLGASVSEIGRQGCAISGSFTRAFEEMVAMVERSLADRLPAPERRRLAVATVTAQIGAIAVSRGVAKTDMALSDEALQAVRETIDAALTAVTARSGSD
jgi:TetR/AcrR family transcriptional regulator, transcriptional repressor for nem operon